MTRKLPRCAQIDDLLAAAALVAHSSSASPAPVQAEIRRADGRPPNPTMARTVPKRSTSRPATPVLRHTRSASRRHRSAAGRPPSSGLRLTVAVRVPNVPRVQTSTARSTARPLPQPDMGGIRDRPRARIKRPFAKIKRRPGRESGILFVMDFLVYGP